MNRRLPAFITVGAIGFLIQLGSLALMTMVVGWPYEPATAIAVELAVVHNFWWHERWTWRDRTDARAGVIGRFVRYQLTTGFTSIGGNLICTAAGVELLGFTPMAANGMAVALMSVANFLAADRWVFARGTVVVVTAALAAVPAQASAAELGPDTIAAWNRYVAGTEARWRHQRPEARDEGPRGESIGVPGGTIHDWRGSTLVHSVTVETLIHALMYPGTPPPQEDVLEARVLGRSGDSLRVYLKVVRRTIMTVTYETEHLVTFERQGPGLACSRSISTRIAESDGRDRGFLWRLNSYWRYVQVGRDVRVEMQSLSLSRDVPTLLKPVAGPVVNRIARESMTKTLDAVRQFFERS
jgi:putative flippase GtrA